MPANRIVNLADLVLQPIGDRRGFAARVARAGPLIGATGLGCSLVVVPPGKSACPFHRHHGVHELFVILEGQGVARLDEATLPIRAGDIIACPAGAEAHQILNTGDVDLRYLALSADRDIDVIEYPDTGKIAVDAGMVPGSDVDPPLNLFGRLVPADYYDDEG